MLSCEEFRRRAGAKPQRLGRSERLHWLMCRACGRFLQETRALDRLIASALSIDVTPPDTRLDEQPQTPIQALRSDKGSRE